MGNHLCACFGSVIADKPRRASETIQDHTNAARLLEDNAALKGIHSERDIGVHRDCIL